MYIYKLLYINCPPGAHNLCYFGFSELRVVDPRRDIKSNNSKALAAGAIDVLEYAKDISYIERMYIRPSSCDGHNYSIVSP